MIGAVKAIVYQTNPAGWALCKLLGRLVPSLLTGPANGVALRQVNPPELPGKDWVRLRTRLGGICGSDVAIVAQKLPPDSVLQGFAAQPFVPGHEAVAEVVEVGREVDPGLIGRRVVVEPTLGCVVRGTEPACPRCQAGEFGVCENFSGAMGGSANIPAGTSIGYGGGTGGSWAEQFVAHQSQLIPLDDSISDAQGVVVDPLACSLHGVLRAKLDGVQRVLVYGAGLLGIGTVRCLRAMGYAGQIDVLARGQAARDRAAESGAEDVFELPASPLARGRDIARRTGATLQEVRFGNYMISGGYDLIFDCIGSARSVNECLKWTRSRGQVVMVGTLQKGAIDLTPLWFRELTVLGAYGRCKEDYQGRRVSTSALVVELIGQGQLRADDLLTHTFGLDQYRDALKMALHKSRHGAIKIAFDFRKPETATDHDDAEGARKSQS
jgi:L-iditol 2-dehydrogenase